MERDLPALQSLALEDMLHLAQLHLSSSRNLAKTMRLVGAGLCRVQPATGVGFQIPCAPDSTREKEAGLASTTPALPCTALHTGGAVGICQWRSSTGPRAGPAAGGACTAAGLLPH